MTHLNATRLTDSLEPIDIATMLRPPCNPVVVVISDSPDVASVLDNLCEFLGIGVEILCSEIEIGPFLRRCQPMAVVAELDGAGQDGCNVMMQVADHDPGLPILMLTGHEPELAGAADAVEELWQLTSVTKVPDLPGIGQLAEFLFRAGRRGDCLRMLPAL